MCVGPDITDPVISRVIMKTVHQMIFKSANIMSHISPECVDLIVTSPPYPMIKMWDDSFAAQDHQIKKALNDGDGLLSFELMNQILDKVWDEVVRILKPGGFACINIGDAVRTIDANFMLYPNQSRVLTHMLNKGLIALPAIIWRKQLNAPNKFMGSGTLPAGAYVTLEHEYILIFRKHRKREFQQEADKQNRRESAIFWEERNNWFSDIWMDLKGTGQKMSDKKVRQRSGAFPFEIPYRLINMFSVKGDTVVDPFLGTGTTMLAAMAAGRNSIGYEVEADLHNTILSGINSIVNVANERIRNRIKTHFVFVEQRMKHKGKFKHQNRCYGFPVITLQEKDLLLNQLLSMEKVNKNRADIIYADEPQQNFCEDWGSYYSEKHEPVRPGLKKHVPEKQPPKLVQLGLLD